METSLSGVAKQLAKVYGARLTVVTGGMRVYVCVRVGCWAVANSLRPGMRGCGLAIRDNASSYTCVEVPAAQGIEQVDATGAGDAFFGGVIASIAHWGFPTDNPSLTRLGAVASSAGAACCEVVGALPLASSRRVCVYSSFPARCYLLYPWRSSRPRVESLCSDAKQMPVWSLKPKRTPEAVKESIQLAVTASFTRDVNTTQSLATHYTHPDALASLVDVCQSIASRAASGNGGTVYVTGIGKSGAVGNRIAVSLRSIGVRASYVHGSEWAHGDLGGLHPNDLLVLLSHSGNTLELVQLLSHAQTLGVETVAIVGATPSSVLKSSSSKLALGADAKVKPPRHWTLYYLFL
jgi:D-arabinose 5-phosphate isomerase GutQ